MFMINNCSWRFIEEELKNLEWYQNLRSKVLKAYEESIVYTKQEDLFRAFNLCDYDKLKVVILGQDPYFNEGVANGLAFSVNPGVKTPPSLKNIIKELHSDIKGNIDPDLNNWAKQGVLLINSILTVEAKKPKSHSEFGWDMFTNYVINYISNNKKGIAFVLWGNDAIRKEELINKSNNHLVIKSPHPSPLSSYRGFFGSKPFSRINYFLENNGDEPINWYL
ncbi:MAG: uracil-DNA glycosylase [Bacilli bacterium]